MADITDIFGGAYVLPTPKISLTAPPEDQLKNAMEKAGITPPEYIVLDGNIHRFSSDESRNKSDKPGWYIGFRDGIPAGHFGCFRKAVDFGWIADMGRPLTTEEMTLNATRMAELKRMRDDELKRQREVAADASKKIWAKSLMAPEDHPYLQRKGIQPNGVRVTEDGRLIVPITNQDTSISSLQYISEDGSKRFQPGGAISGKYWIMGALDGASPIYIAEGFATAATIREETNCPVVVAFSASNIPKIAETIRKMVGISKIVICADNDDSGVGLRSANEAANAIGAAVIMPPLAGDMNDFKQSGHDLAGLLRPQSSQELRDSLKAVYISDIPNVFIPTDDLVQNILERSTFAMFYGDSNSGKTFLAIDMACHIALGRPWMGANVEQGLVVYLATEASKSVINRVIAFQIHHQVTIPNFLIVQVPLNFYENDNDATRVMEMIRNEEKNRGIKCQLIVGDTLARMASGANENSGEDMGPVMDRFDDLMNGIESTVLLIHHSGKDSSRGSRGWSGLRAHIDTEIEITESNESRKASITKQRAMPSKGMDIYFDLEIIELGEGKWGTPATTCIVKQTTSPTAEYMNKINESCRIIEDAWYCSGKERVNQMPFITRSALIDYIITTKKIKEKTAQNMVIPTSKMMKEIGKKITPEGDHGWVISDPEWLSAINLCS